MFDKISRTALFVILFVSLCFNAYWVVRSARPSRSDPRKFSFLDPNVSTLPHIVDKSEKVSVLSLSPLREKIRPLIADHIARSEWPDNSRIGVYVEDLNTGAWLGLDERERFLPFSLLKVPAVMAAMKRVDRREWTLDQSMTLTEGDIDTRPGVPQWTPLAAGQRMTFQNVLEKMLVESDNTPYFLLTRHLTDDEIDSVYHHLGIDPDEGSDFRRMVTPRKFATLFRALYYSTYLSRSSSQYLLSLMNRAIHVYAIRAAIPPEIAVAHKIGIYFPSSVVSSPATVSSSSVPIHMHDAGIVYYPDRPFMIAVMTAGMKQANATSAIRDIAAAVYEHYERYK